MLKHTQPQATVTFLRFPRNVLFPHVCRGLRDISPGLYPFFLRGSHSPDVHKYHFNIPSFFVVRFIVLSAARLSFSTKF